jgi:hypothetical protein
MRLKIGSGVSIVIVEEGPSKVIFFNRPVRAIELNKQEISQITALLNSDLKTKIGVADRDTIRIRESSKLPLEGL